MPTGERMEEGRARANCEGRNSRRSRGKTAPFDAIAEGKSRIQRERRAQAPTMNMIETSRVEGIFSSATLPWIAESFFCWGRKRRKRPRLHPANHGSGDGNHRSRLGHFPVHRGRLYVGYMEIMISMSVFIWSSSRNTRSARQIGVF